MVRYSVCITNLNSASTLRECLDSVLPQFSGLDAEFVVVDQNSTDGSTKILEEYAAKTKDFRLIKDKRRGRGIGRTLAARAARGEYQIHHLDTDEIFRPVIRKVIDCYHAKERDVGPYTLLATLLITRSGLIEKAGYFPDVVSHEDALMNARLAALAPLIYLPVMYMEHRQDESRRKDAWKVFTETYEYSSDVLRLRALSLWRTYKYILRGKRPGIWRALATVPFVAAVATLPFKERYDFPSAHQNVETPYDYLLPRMGDLDEFFKLCGREHFEVVESIVDRARRYNRA